MSTTEMFYSKGKLFIYREWPDETIYLEYCDSEIRDFLVRIPLFENVKKFQDAIEEIQHRLAPAVTTASKEVVE